jgi:parallel beta-helix repeat protein
VQKEATSMDRWSVVPVFVVIAIGLMVWYIAEPIVGFSDIPSYVKLRAYQWYIDDNSHSAKEAKSAPPEAWLLRTIEPYLIGDNPSPQLQVFKNGQRQNVLYGDSLHNVTITFYIEKGNVKHLEDLLHSLLRYNISKAIFFVEGAFAKDHPFMVQTMKDLGYTVKPWMNKYEYDRNYPPTTFNNIALTDREILTQTSNLADAATFIEGGIHYWNSSIIAFTPSDPPKFQYSPALLGAALNTASGSVHFTDDTKTDANNVLDPTYPNSISMNVTRRANHTLPTDFDDDVNPKTDIIIGNGSWTVDSLQKQYPDAIVKLAQGKDNKESSRSAIPPHDQKEFVMNKTIIIGTDAQLKIVNEKLLIRSDPHDVVPRRLDVIGGRVEIINSTITSWDSERNAPDINAYHPRPYLFVREGGIMDIINSSITHLGFPLGGLADPYYTRAALEYRNTGNFTIANSTIAYNYDGFYTSGAQNFNIIGNKIYSNARYGLDPHTESGHFVVHSNHVHDNGNQGIICSKLCQNVTITNNLVEYNAEGIGLHRLTNSSLVQDNIVRYNERYGIYIDLQSYNNIVQNNTVIGNRNGIGITDRSYGNTLLHNIIGKNELNPIVIDSTSATGSPRNTISKNVIIS